MSEAGATTQSVARDHHDDGTRPKSLALAIADVHGPVRVPSVKRTEEILKVTAALADAVTAEEVFAALVDQVVVAVGASSAALWLVDDGTAKLMRTCGYADEARSKLEFVPIDQAPSIPFLDSIRLGEPIWIPSQATLLERYPHLSSVATAGRSYRISCLTLKAHDRVLGTLALTIDEECEATEEERDFLLLIARYASQAVERLRLFEAQSRARAEATAAVSRLQVLAGASRAFSEGELDLRARLRVVCVELSASLGSCVNISLLNADGDLHLTEVNHPIAEAQALLQELAPKAPLRMGEGVTGRLAATGESVILPSIDQQMIAARAAPHYKQFLQCFPVFAMIGAALRVQGRVVGTVTATRCQEGETYTVEDLRLLEELAERAAVAIENARLYEETQAARTRAEQLYLFAQAVVAADTVDSVHDAALVAIKSALRTDRCAVLTYRNDDVMRFRAWSNLSDSYRQAVEGHSPWPRSTKAPEPVLVVDVESDPAMTPYLSLFRSEGIGALAFIPLVTRGQLLGKFMIYFDHPHAFLSHEIETARAIANHLASVITRFAVVEKLEDTIRQNELFAGALAHDLRNPLNAITTGAQLLLMWREGEGRKGDAEIKPLSRILSSGQRMTTMINQLLDFTLARSGGGIAIQAHDTDLADLCAQVVDELELSHPDWIIRREVLGHQRGSWDSARLLQVFSNLVANAGQHGTLDAGIEIKLDGTAVGDVKIDIHNDGVIPETLVPHLFEPFRTTRHRGSQSCGLGLGLFIVREIVRAHGGTVDVVSSEATGTTFSIRLPRNTVPQ